MLQECALEQLEVGFSREMLWLPARALPSSRSTLAPPAHWEKWGMGSLPKVGRFALHHSTHAGHAQWQKVASRICAAAFCATASAYSYMWGCSLGCLPQ